MGRILDTNKYEFDENVTLGDYLIGTNGVIGKPTKNYMVLHLFRAFQEFAGTTYMTLNDISDPTYVYYGGCYLGNQWIIFRYPKNDLNDKQQATVGFNTNNNTLQNAWDNRQTLTYN